MIVIIQNNIMKLNSAAENYIGLVELQFSVEKRDSPSMRNVTDEHIEAY